MKPQSNLIRINRNTLLVAFYLSFAVILNYSCKTGKKPKSEVNTSIHMVTAQAETKPVPRDSITDSADDPAIWINFALPDSSRIIGTDKKGGLAVYDLSGQELFYYNTGFMNNADLRYQFPLGPDTIDILSVSNRTDQTVDIYKINKDGSLQVVHKQQLKSMLKEEVYGLCMYRSKFNGVFYVFVNDKYGVVEQWELFAKGDKIDGRIIRNLKLASQVEGMVADDETGTLFVGEEDKGIWKFNAEPSAPDKGDLIPMSGEQDNQNILFDIEGLAIYELSGGGGYLIASSQGNSSYALFRRDPPHKYLGSFKIVDGASIDGAEGTDGLDVSSFPFEEKYPEGILVVQDGHNKDRGIAAPQNFKIIRWDSIATKFDLFQL
jgi:3-phytase